MENLSDGRLKAYHSDINKLDLIPLNREYTPPVCRSSDILSDIKPKEWNDGNVYTQYIILHFIIQYYVFFYLRCTKVCRLFNFKMKKSAFVVIIKL